jgi:hypothetical protein
MGTLLVMMLGMSMASGCGRATQQADTTGVRVILVPATDTIEEPEAPARQTTDDPPSVPPPDPAPAQPPRETDSKKRKAWIPEPLAPQPFLGGLAHGPGWRR